MPVVVADTSPLNYLLLINQIELLPCLFDTVHIPAVVRDELTDENAPPLVRDWISKPPSWLSINSTSYAAPRLPKLDAGELAALALALELNAELILIDDRAAAKAARAQGLTVIGTLGILGRAAARDFVDLPAALARLTLTSFHVNAELMDTLLKKYPTR